MKSLEYDSSDAVISASDVADTPDNRWYVAALAFRNNNFYATAQQAHRGNRYVCECPGSMTNIFASNNLKNKKMGSSYSQPERQPQH